jgi:hydrogenase maturation protease
MSSEKFERRNPDEAGAKFLVIGYGNTLRRDDGVGVRAAEALAELKLPGVRVLTRHQLVPELAEIISQARVAIFVDAKASRTNGVELNAIEPAAGQILAHVCDPRSLLALSEQLFGHSPRAWTLAIPAEDFDFGDSLSPRAQDGLRVAMEKIRQLTTQDAHNACPAQSKF